MNTQCESDTLDPMSQKLDDENVSIEFHVMSLEKENEHLKLREQLHTKSSEQNNTVKVTSHSVPITRESKVMKNANVIAPGMFRINPLKYHREDNFVPNKQFKASIKTKPFTVSQPHVITKNDVNSNSNGLSSTRLDNTAKTRRPLPRINTRMIGSRLRLRVVASRIKKLK
ncbi:hypothetical protein Tco_0805138 [Tanacetum coccineum]